MNRKRKLSLIGLLMVSAQVLIIVMVVQWLSMQYREKQQALGTEISRAWTGAHQQMIDSMLMNQYILPAMDTAREERFMFKFSTDSTEDVRIITATGSNNATESNHTATKGNQSETGSNQSGTGGNHTGEGVQSKTELRMKRLPHTAIFRSKPDTSETDVTKELVLRGVKLFVNIQSDSVTHLEHASENMMPDTSVLKKAFRTKLQALNPRIIIAWDTAENGDSLKHSSSKFTYSAVVNDLDLRADIKGSNKVLLPEILPQGLFALLLIVITATAFLISYRSLKAQMILDLQRNDFIHNMSHEIRTPVSTVKVALEALKNFDRSSDPGIMKEYLEMATHETNRLEQLVSRVTDLSTDNAPAAVNLQEIDLNMMVEEVLQSMKPRLEGEKAVVNFKLSPAVALVDKLHLHGVLVNLIDNSLKYCVPPALIDIETEQTDDYVRIIVSDRGQGIPAAYADRIFEKFFRVPAGDVHNTKGYGLGLSYAAMVMKQHKGNIIYKPREGGGSRFILAIRKSQNSK